MGHNAPRPDPGVCTRVITVFYFIFFSLPICLLGFFAVITRAKAQKGVGVDFRGVCGNNLMQAILRIQVSALSASSAIADAWVVSLSVLYLLSC